MEDDPENRRFMEKHWYTMPISDKEGLVKEQVQERRHQIQRAIAEIERKERQQQHGTKQVQLNNVMRVIL